MHTILGFSQCVSNSRALSSRGVQCNAGGSTYDPGNRQTYKISITMLLFIASLGHEIFYLSIRRAYKKI